MNANTAQAIDTFHKLVRAERRVDRLNQELRRFVVGIPADEMQTYISATEEEK